MAVVPSLSKLFVPRCTKTDPPLPDPMFSTLSVIASTLAPGKQTTTSSPLLKTVSLPNYRVPHKHPRSPPHHLYH